MSKVIAIFGPPGTGKTRTLVNMAGDKRALFLSFTKAAAAEVVSRAGSDKVKAATIHSIVFNASGMMASSVVSQKKLAEFSIVTGFPFKDPHKGVDEIQEGDEYMSVMSYMNNRMISREEAYEHFGRPGTWPRFNIFIESYLKWKAAYGFVDFDDMLLQYLSSKDNLGYSSIYLDEAQDCSPLQWVVFKHMCRNCGDVTIAGDDDQAIYEWNGADPHGMMEFVGTNEDSTAHILDQSYRVPVMVHDFVHEKILPEIGRRVHKEFRPANKLGLIVRYGDVSNIDLWWLYNTGGAMILARDRWRLEEIKRMLNRDMVPYDVLGGNSPWTNITARKLRAGEEIDKNSASWVFWKEFYAQADLTMPINITLSTIHQAKGREAPRVVLDLSMPGRTLEAMYSDMSAEMRVMYVALTRTSETLILCGSNPIL